MISIADFKAFEEPLVLIKMPRDKEACRVQVWRMKSAKDAEALFLTLSAMLDGDPEVGPYVSASAAQSTASPWLHSPGVRVVAPRARKSYKSLTTSSRWSV